MALTIMQGFEGLKQAAMVANVGYGTNACGYPTSVSGTPTVATTYANGGTQALRCNPTASTAYLVWNAGGSGLTGGVNTAELTLSYYFRVENLPSAAGTYAITYINCDTIGDFTVNLVTAGTDSTSATVRLAWQGGSGNVDIGTVSEGDGWHTIVLGIDLNGGSAISKCALDGVESTGPTAGNGSFNAATVLAVGAYSSSTWDVWFDDIVVHNTYAEYDGMLAAAQAAGWKIWGAQPTSDGTHSISTGYVTDASATNITNATTTAYTHVDEPPFESADTSYWSHAINATESTGRVAVKVTAPGDLGGTIVAVEHDAFFAPIASNTKNLSSAGWDGASSAAFFTDRQTFGAKAGGYAVGGVRTTNPSAAAWAWTDLDTLELRVWSTLATCRTYGQVLQVLYTVTPSAAAGGETGQLARSYAWSAFQVRVKSGGTGGSLGVSAVAE